MLQQFVPSVGDAWSVMLTALASDPQSATRLAADVGALTRDLHDALASRPHDTEFPSRTATPGEAAQWRSAAEHQLTLALSAVTGDVRDQLGACRHRCRPPKTVAYPAPARLKFAQDNPAWSIFCPWSGIA